MDFLELAWNRKCVRSFKSDDVPAALIMRLLSAAQAAPSGGNCQPWHFYVIKDAAIGAKLHAAAGGRQQMLLDAPVHIVVCAEPARSGGRYGDRGRELYCIQDAAAAIENLLLCAADEGLAACWCGAFDEAAVSDALALEKGRRPVAVIPVGYAAGEPAKPQRRPPEEVTTFIGFEGGAAPAHSTRRVTFEHSDMGGALFNDLNLAGSEFTNINMRGAMFSDINLSEGSITNANLSHLAISDCLLDGFTVNGKAVLELLNE